jgi:shikimate dehydrogenase
MNAILVPSGDQDEAPMNGAVSGLTAVDAITNPRLTPLLRTAKERGCAVVDGVEMLVQLAMQHFESWTGVTPEGDVLQRAVSAALG